MQEIVARATIDFVDGTPVVTWSPNVADGARIYRSWSKKSLVDADWMQVDAASAADRRVRDRPHGRWRGNPCLCLKRRDSGSTLVGRLPGTVISETIIVGI